MKGHMKFRFGIVLVLISLSWLMLTSAVFAESEELAEIREAIKARGAHWTPGESWVTRLSPQERRNLLGEKTLELGIIEPKTTVPLLPLGYPSAIDWRNKDGYNWITPIRDQQDCGSCVAFGSVATLESLVRIETNQPELNIDLSEMHLFNCGGGSCLFGWYNSSACSYLKNNGTPDEACWPYQDVNKSCSQNTCPDWQTRAYKITNYGAISGIEACKTYVAIAPILVAFEVYTDFFYYTEGIYEHTWGGLEGGHAVSIVGYDTSGPVPYWIVKNSWGPSWGEAGFFKIKMGECAIETRSSYWMSGAILPSPSVSVSLTPDGVVVPRGGTLGYSVTLTNNTNSSQTFKFWTNMTLPNGNIYPPDGTLIGPVTVTLSPYGSKTRHLSQRIPQSAPLGNYIYNAFAGPYPTVWSEDHFDFTVVQSLSE